ncbi:hypothetical protein TNCV_267881 [Trichonephila clavipes]|nr:hypothetical protein TNCV_267881 [Trichonephila clavipes]
MATGSYMTPIYSRSQSEVQGDLHNCLFPQSDRNSCEFADDLGSTTSSSSSISPRTRLDTDERQSQIGAALNLATSTIRTILKNKENILSSATATTTSSATRITRSRNNTIEEMERWIDNEIEHKMPLSQSTFLIKRQKIGNTAETK